MDGVTVGRGLKSPLEGLSANGPACEVPFFAVTIDLRCTINHPIWYYLLPHHFPCRRERPITAALQRRHFTMRATQPILCQRLVDAGCLFNVSRFNAQIGAVGDGGLYCKLSSRQRKG